MEILKLMKKLEFALNTKGVCFLCQQKPEFGTSEETVKKEVCLRSFCKFLNINSYSVLRRGLGEGGNGDNKKVPCGFSVTLCRECEGVVERLDELVKQQEIAKMQLEYQVKVLSDILKAPVAEVGGDEEVMILEEEEVDALNTKLVTLLREETAVKCAAKLRNEQLESFPKVTVHRMTRQNLPRKRDPDADIEHIEPDTTTGQESNHDQQEDSTPPETETPGASTSKTPSELLQIITTQRCKKVGPAAHGGKSRFQCIFCKNLLSASDKLRSHVTNIHPEELLMSAKRQNVSELQFHACCRLLLTRETVKARQQGSTTGASSSNTITCLFCGKACTNSERYKEHLICLHFSVLKPALIKFQDEDFSSLQDISSHSQPGRRRLGKTVHKAFSSKKAVTINKQKFSSSSNRTWICSIAEGGCGKKFSSKTSLNGHQRKACSKNPTKLTCKGCGLKFGGKYALNCHTNKCPNQEHIHKLADAGNNRPNQWARRSLPKRTCVDCGDRRFYSKVEFEKHMQQVHGRGLKERREDLKERVVILESVDIPHSRSSSPCPSEMPKLQEPEQVNMNPTSTANENVPLPRLRRQIPEEDDLRSVSCWCGEPYEGRAMIQCDKCHVWYHMSCEGIKERDKIPKSFQCNSCT